MAVAKKCPECNENYTVHELCKYCLLRKYNLLGKSIAPWGYDSVYMEETILEALWKFDDEN